MVNLMGLQSVKLSIFLILSLSLSVGRTHSPPPMSPTSNLEKQAPTPEPHLTKNGIFIALDDKTEAFRLRAGSLDLSLPVHPTLDEKDIKTIANENTVNIQTAQSLFQSEFESLSLTEKERFNRLRMNHLVTATRMFRLLRFILTPASWAFTSLNWTGQKLKASITSMKSKLGFRVEISPEAEQDLYSSSDVMSLAQDPNHSPSENYQVDLIGDALKDLNKILYKKACSVLNYKEMGIIVGTGAIANFGLKYDGMDLKLGGVGDILILFGKNDNTKSFVFTLQSVNERVVNNESPVTILPGVNLKVGYYLRGSTSDSFQDGESNYPSATVTGTSVYDSQITAWTLTTEFFPFLIGNDYMGYNTKATLSDVLRIESRGLAKLVFELQRQGVLKWMYLSLLRAKQSKTPMGCKETLSPNIKPNNSTVVIKE